MKAFPSRVRSVNLRQLVTLGRISTDRVTLAAGIYLVAWLAIALFGPTLSGLDPDEQRLSTLVQPPSGDHLLGTDALGRDLWARILAGAGVSLSAVSVGVGVALVVGLIPGLVAGYLGGRTDFLIMRTTEILISFPTLILAIAIIGVTGPGLQNAMIAIGLVLSPSLIRVVRSSVLSVREETYIESARLAGGSNVWILRKHVLPNVIATVIVMVNLLAAQVLLAEAGLSYIGLGLAPPAASWGSLLHDGTLYFRTSPWLIFFPGVAITLTVLALNLFGDGLRRASQRSRT